MLPKGPFIVDEGTGTGVGTGAEGGPTTGPLGAGGKGIGAMMGACAWDGEEGMGSM